MKKFELTFTFLQVPLDYLAIALAGITAYALRFTEFITSIRPVIFNLPWSKYLPAVLIAGAGWVLIFAFSGLYSTDPNRKFAREVRRIVLACSTGFAAITIYVFFTLQKFDSRFLVLAGWILATVYVVGMRLVMHGVKVTLYHYGVGARRAVIIGNQNIAHQIADTMKSKKYLGYKVVAEFEHFSGARAVEILAARPDEIIFADPKTNEDETLQAIDFANEHHLVFKYSADLFDTISTNMAVSTVAGIPIIELRRTRLTGWGRIFKRALDILVSALLLLILSPVYLLVALVILAETGRPVIYKNERVGQAGKKFFTLKFRSMRQKDCTGLQFGADGIEAMKREEELIAQKSVKTGPVYKIADDPRVTAVGRFIRRWSLDELPQFWNILRGDMSLVGPRPHQPREVDQYQKHHKTVLTLKPGLTGMAQISGRSDLSFEDEVRLDTFYIEHWNLFLDLIILVKTPFVVLRKKGAW